MWNSIEAIYEFGTINLKPGDRIVFTDAIDMGDKLLPGESKHGEGYYGTTNGMCNASTTLSELFGTGIVMPDGKIMPLFVARPGSVQPHDMAHNPTYYEYAYHGPGVAVNSSEYGSLPFMMNPNLPPGIQAELSMSFTDTDPSNSYRGVYKPTASVKLTGIPSGYKVSFQRLSANRTYLLQRMTGTQDYYLSKANSLYFDRQGNPVISPAKLVFVPPETRKNKMPQHVLVSLQTNMRALQQNRFKEATQVPDDMVNDFIYPGGFAHKSTTDRDGNRIWKTRDEWLPLAPEDLPPLMTSISASEYARILSWNNISDPDNVRYKMIAKNGTTYCIVAMTDWAQAYRLAGNGESVPLPRWVRGEKLTTNGLYDWLFSEQAKSLGWKNISAEEAGIAANTGFFTLVIAQNKDGNGHIAAVTPGPGIRTPDGKFYPNTAQAGYENWGPEAGKTVLDTFSRLPRLDPKNWSAPTYFVWIP